MLQGFVVGDYSLTSAELLSVMSSASKTVDAGPWTLCCSEAEIPSPGKLQHPRLLEHQGYLLIKGKLINSTKRVPMSSQFHFFYIHSLIPVAAVLAEFFYGSFTVDKKRSNQNLSIR